ncbi:hypothetical protein EDC04DRAFT_1353681 [Pisolithus marmoratus]|nr:hypothetical protein EDC04DRAFT_1353681 [Pisolithus marmoratus]
MDPLDDPKHLTEPVTVETAVGFFVDMFGGGDIRNFIGEIVFFRDLPRIMEMGNYTELDAGIDKGHYSTQDISGSREINDWSFSMQLSPAFDVQVGSWRTGYWTTLWKNGSGWSAPFSAQVLELIATAYGWRECPNIEFDRREFVAEVERIKEWREMLIGSNDEHERRTLVEDTVGKILLVCWWGVESEIVKVLGEACKFPLYDAG